MQILLFLESHFKKVVSPFFNSNLYPEKRRVNPSLVIPRLSPQDYVSCIEKFSIKQFLGVPNIKIEIELQGEIMQFYFPTKCESVGEIINNDNNQFKDGID